LGSEYEGTLFPERHVLSLPQSPHLAARKEGLEIRLSDFVLPSTRRPLIVEGAGGCLAPLNEKDGVIDIATHLGLAVIFVTRFYLGAYNHTLLSIEAIQKRGIKILGLILNGGDEPEFREFISRKTGLEFLGIIPRLTQVDSSTIETLVQTWREKKS
jgi:dethiobiotin synthetase